MNQSKKKTSNTTSPQLKESTSPTLQNNFDVNKSSKYLNQGFFLKTNILEYELISKKVNDKNIQKYIPKKEYQVNNFNFGIEISKMKL